MASFTDTLGFNDYMTPVLKDIASQAQITSDIIQMLQNSTADPAMAAGYEAMAVQIAVNNAELQKMQDEIKRLEQAQPPVNQGFKNWQMSITGVNQALELAKRIIAWIKNTTLDLIKDANDQIEAETRLLSVLGANAGVTREQYNQLKEMTAQRSQQTSYSEAALTAGLSELATYRLSAGALEEMLGTLSDYAAGQGGVNVSSQQMIGLANQLGKALDGNYGGLTKIGFALDENQKAIIATGTEMEKVAVISEVIGQSYGGLAEALANTPLGQMQQLENIWGNIRKEVGNRLLPAMGKINDAQRRFMDLLQSDAAIAFYDAIFIGAQIGATVIAALVDGVTWLMERFLFCGDAAKFLFITAIGAGAAFAIPWLVQLSLHLVKVGTTGFMSGLKTLMGWMPVLLPFLLIGAAIAAVVLIFDKMGITGEDVAGKISGAFSVMGAIVKNIFIGIENAWTWLTNKIGKFIAWTKGETFEEKAYKDYIDLEEAWNSGEEAGRQWARDLEDMFTFKPFEFDDESFKAGIPNVDYVDEIGSINNPVRLDREDLRYLLDERERRYIANVNLEAPAPTVIMNVEMSGNAIEEMDEYLRELGKRLREAVEANVVINPV
ncbi:MAG: hypothetical protein FWF06_03765 [Symbiobacteriaceae bacterium]|nr:hypothetical protein [Symbiobacteriaceae bacterium]